MVYNPRCPMHKKKNWTRIHLLENKLPSLIFLFFHVGILINSTAVTTQTRECGELQLSGSSKPEKLELGKTTKRVLKYPHHCSSPSCHQSRHNSDPRSTQRDLLSTTYSPGGQIQRTDSEQIENRLVACLSDPPTASGFKYLVGETRVLICSRPRGRGSSRASCPGEKQL